MTQINKTTDSARGAGDRWRVVRRDFLKASGLVVAGLASPLAVAGKGGAAKLSFGIVTDAHYADVPAPSSGRGRIYRESLTKMTECVQLMNEKKVDFLIEMGDLIDKGAHGSGKEAAIQHLDAIEAIYKTFDGPRYHVLGNHDMDKLSKAQFTERIENTGIKGGATYFSYDRKGVHFVVLDSCFTADGKPYDSGNFGWKDTNVPDEQLAWLEKDLAATAKPVVVFGHQLLCGEGSHYVKNAAQVRQVLEKSKRVVGVFNGHNHAGKYSLIEGIHYYTLKAMVEGSGEANNSYAIVDVHADNSLTITGYRRAVSKEL